MIICHGLATDLRLGVCSSCRSSEEHRINSPQQTAVIPSLDWIMVNHSLPPSNSLYLSLSISFLSFFGVFVQWFYVTCSVCWVSVCLLVDCVVYIGHNMGRRCEKSPFFALSWEMKSQSKHRFKPFFYSPNIQSKSIIDSQTNTGILQHFFFFFLHREGHCLKIVV